MTVELGQVSLLAALLTALCLGLFPMIGAYTGNRRLMAVASSAALIQFLLVADLIWDFDICICKPGFFGRIRSPKQQFSFTNELPVFGGLERP